MATVLWVTFPFFALVLAGYLAVQQNFLSVDAIPGLNSFVLFFALPCLLFRFGANTPIAQLLDAPLFITYAACGLILVAVVVAWSLNDRIRWNDAALGALVAAFPNTGFLGVPLLVALLGPSSAGPAIVSIIADLLFTSSLCIALSRMDGAGEHGFRHAAFNALKGVLANPMPWAVCLGALFSANEWRLAEPVDKTLSLLADAASPVALFTIGAVLARSQVRARLSPHKAIRLMDYLPVALVKLVVHPCLVMLVGATVIQAGVPLDPYALMVVVLVAALPSASNVSMLAERFGADNGRIAQIILITTALAFFTFSGAVFWLKP
jgi:malonate transporter and related proteins